jgi:hypothetical protein
MNDYLLYKKIGATEILVEMESDDLQSESFLQNICRPTLWPDYENEEWVYCPSTDTITDYTGQWVTSSGECCGAPNFAHVEIDSPVYFLVSAASLEDALFEGRRCWDLYLGKWYPCVLTARIVQHGITLNIDNLYGVESDATPEYLKSTAREMIYELLGATQYYVIQRRK